MEVWLHRILGAIGILALVSAAYAWYHPKVMTQTVYAPPNVITKTETVTLPCHPVEVVKYRDRFIEKEKIPQGLIPLDSQITGEARITPSEAPQAVISLLDQT